MKCFLLLVTINTPEGQFTAAELWEMLQNERQDFEDELAEQTKSIREASNSAKKEHEEEMTQMIGENETLQDMLEEAQNKVINAYCT